MTEQPWSAAKDPQDTSAAAAVPAAAAASAAAEYLNYRVPKIAALIKAIDKAEQTPDLLLDIEIASDQEEYGRETGTQAEYFFVIARECRDKARSIASVLQGEGWTDNSELLLDHTFKALVDAWSAYKSVLIAYSSARWGGQPSPDQVVTGLARTRRNYIDALDAYLVQMLVVQKTVERAVEPRG